jgi:hypothetical protein
MQVQNEIEQNIVIQGEIENKYFTIEINQYNGVNRLEFVLKSELLEEIIVHPSFKISKSLINYPFGIEETKRTNIQTLDFLWLIGENNSIIYIQNNSQQFVINRSNFEIHNLLKKKGRYEFSISLLHDNDFQSAYEQVTTYKFKLLGTVIQGSYEDVKKSDSWLSINPKICLINLWRRDNCSFLRLLNPRNKMQEFTLKGSLINQTIKEIDFNYNVKKELRNNTLIINAWKIQNLKF